MEPLNIPDLLERTKQFPPKLRPLMAVFGTLQGALSLLFGEEVKVRVVRQEDSGDTVEREVEREVELVAGDTVVATAMSHMNITTARPRLLSDIAEGRMGIGQMLTKHGINYQTRLVDCGEDGGNQEFWRSYDIVGHGVSITITERFPEELYR